MAQINDTGAFAYFTVWGRGFGAQVKEGHRIDASDDIVQVQVTSEVSGSVHWTLSLITGRTNVYQRDVQVGDWVEIYLANATHTEIAVWGQVQSVNLDEHATGSFAVSERVAISGTGYWQTISAMETLYDPILASVFEYPTILMELANATLQGLTTSPAVVARVLKLYTTAEKSPQARLPTGHVLGDFIDFENGIVPATKDDGTLLFVGDPQQINGTLGASVERFADKSVNYLLGSYVKRPGIDGPLEGPDGSRWAPIVLHGPLPFDPATFDAMAPYTVVASREVRSVQVGRQANDIFNWFRVTPEVLGTSIDSLKAIAGPIINKDSIARHGIRRFEATTAYAFPQEGSRDSFDPANPPASVLTLLKNRLFQLAGWYNENEILMSGTMQCRLLPDLRPGRRLLMQDDFTGHEYAFFVEGVTHMWSYFPAASSTSLRLTRGHPATKEFREFRAAWRDRLSNGSMLGDQGSDPGTRPPLAGRNSLDAQEVK